MIAHDTVPSDAEIDRQHDIADRLMAIVARKLTASPDVDPIGVYYAMWVSLTRILAESGWAADELVRDLHHHVAHQTSEGSA
jgi:hypothetical protein